jgi:hypothetical protein
MFAVVSWTQLASASATPAKHVASVVLERHKVRWRLGRFASTREPEEICVKVQSELKVTTVNAWLEQHGIPLEFLTSTHLTLVADQIRGLLGLRRTLG